MRNTVGRCSADTGRAVSVWASAVFSAAANSARRRRTSVGALAVLVGGCLSACGTGTGLAPAAGGSATVAGPIPSGLESFYHQAVDWYSCGATGGMEKVSEKTAQASASTTAAAATASAEATAAPGSGSMTGTAGSSEGTDDATFSCAVITVPLDYAKPQGETISIAMKKRAATGGHPQGALFINPGGPGDSGVAFAEQAGTSFAPELLSAYDVIGFDPRGVGSSTAITCTTDDDSASTAEPSPTASAGAASGTGSFEEWSEATRQSFQELADQCAANTKPAALLDHVDTVSAARDLDILRALAGQEKLTYLGFSYGTYLGAVYAEHFPANTGRIVLDGAIDPSLSLAEQGLGQATGFEQALRT